MLKPTTRSLFFAAVLAMLLTVSTVSAVVHNQSLLAKVDHIDAAAAPIDAVADALHSDMAATNVHSLAMRGGSDLSTLDVIRRHRRSITKRCSAHAEAEHEKKKKHKHHKHHKGDKKKNSKKSSSSKNNNKDAGSSSSSSSDSESTNNDSDVNYSASSKGKQDNTDSSSSSATSGKVSDVAGTGSYTRVQQNRGDGFWSGNNWDFWSYADPTHGQVAFQTQQSAKSKSLIGMKDGAAFMRVSNKDIGGGNRESVRFQSKKAYDSGLVIFDVVKMPVGCGTWPALWTTKGDNWPHGGEIDVVEGVGYTAGGANANQMTVHLGQDSPLQLNRRAQEKRASFTGRVVQGATNCNQWGSHTGCAFFDTNKNGPSWGEDFNAAGGGIWAMEFGKGNGVKIWFWGRKSGSIPKELDEPSKSPTKLDPSSWGKPVANFQSSVINSAIKAQNIIMDITLFGDWAGNVPMDGHCKGQNMQSAIKKGSNYDDAEFVINAIDVYCQNGKC